jgi:RNA-directed DNA polymerase
MKSYLQKLRSIPHLHSAWKKLKKKRYSRGFDNVTIENFRKDLPRNLEALHEELRNGTFQFTPLLGVLNDKPGGGKRPLKIPTVRDRVVLKAIEQLIEHKFRRYNLDCSYGYISGIAVSDAIKRVNELHAVGNEFVLEGDISKFFDSVDTNRLMDRFVREIRITSLEDLICRALKTEVGNLDDFRPEDREMFPAADSGIPQGGVLSPLLANFYLYTFDKEMTDANYNLVRYADDFVVMCKTADEATAAYHLADGIFTRLGLRLHPLGDENSKTKITRYSKGFVFLGLHFQAGTVAPSVKAVNRFREKVSTILDPRQGHNLLRTLNALKHTIDGWARAYCQYDSLRTFRGLDKFICENFSKYLRDHGLIRHGHLINREQRKFFGIPSLEGILLRGAAKEKSKTRKSGPSQQPLPKEHMKRRERRNPEARINAALSAQAPDLIVIPHPQIPSPRQISSDHPKSAFGKSR